MTIPIIPFTAAFFTLIPRKSPPYLARAILPVTLTPAAFSAAKSSLWPRLQGVSGLLHRLERTY